MKLRLFLLWSVSILFGLAVSGQTPGDNSTAAPHPLRISESVTSTLVAERAPVKYPDSARASGVQGTVVLDVVVSQSGDVKDVSVVSGNADLAKAAADAVKQWKYKPYVIDGAPVEIETQVTVGFNLRPRQLPEPSLGNYRDGIYRNDFFGFEYPLSRDWVRETELTRSRSTANGQNRGTYVLLAAVHIPQRSNSQEADASFVLSAFDSGGRGCEQYFQGLAADIHSQKQAQQKGAVASMTIAGREFYRADFDFSEDPSRRTFICTQAKGYLLQWVIAGLFKDVIESTIATLNAIQSVTPASDTLSNGQSATAATAPQTSGTQQKIVSVRVSQGVTQGMKTKDVAPIYPENAKRARIQGAVIMAALIDKNGDIADLEVLNGPIELAVSAVNAVRLWKYRPYILKGEPVAVHTTITVNYTLSY